ncbi:phosphatidylserine decarboxylase family protein [Candidatus Woesearchaeota archaeon]|nr:phosphatidylserine decarboxylase family protein [Candidatus Woesearchaeota archaeon]
MLTDILLIGISSLTAIVLAFYIFYKFYFLRNPKRTVPKGNNIVSPADGKIVKIIKVSSSKTDNKNKTNKSKTEHLTITKGMFGKIKTLIEDVDKECYLIQIMLTPFDVHYQRAPIDGTVTIVSYTEGKFQNAVKDAASLRCLENEKNEMVFTQKLTNKNKKFSVKVIQIAGVLARRIVCFVRAGKEVKKGEEIGLITLGSQVSLIIPSNCSLKIKEGQYIYGGKTIIADIK